jgi:SRSO17 transposase
VQRQYTGTAGRIENSHVAVYLTYASGKGHALIDRRLYLPRSWTEAADRLARAGVPDETAFATKPSLAQDMITDALAGGARAAWVAGDEVYGADSKLRKHARQAGQGYGRAIAKDHQIVTGIGTRRVVDLAVRLPSTPGSGCRPGVGRGANAGTTGRWSTRATRPLTRPLRAPGTTGC